MKIRRIIPSLTILNGDLVKTQIFDQKNCNYIGDLLNTVRIFNDKEAEEIIVTDIGASINNLEPNFEIIKKLSNIARMPITYGGGIKNISQAKKIFSYGIEKISLSSAIFENFELIKEFKNEFGSQSISVVIDIKKQNSEYFIFINNGYYNTKLKPNNFIDYIQDYAGEIIINNIDHDGLMNGTDDKFIESIYSKIKIPLIIMGGIGSVVEISKFFKKYNIIGVACSSLFIYKGTNKAVLINYPRNEILSKIE